MCKFSLRIWLFLLVGRVFLSESYIPLSIRITFRSFRINLNSSSIVFDEQILSDIGPHLVGGLMGQNFEN